MPLTLIILHALFPAAGLAGLLLRTAAIALLITYTALAGVWLFPPWWTPWAMAALLLLATIPAARAWRSRKRRAWLWHAGDVLVALAIGGIAVHLLLPTINGRALRPNAIDLAPPLEAGAYLVLSGGHELAINAHLMTLAPQFGDFLGQSYGVDISAVDGFGLRADGIMPEDPKAIPDLRPPYRRSLRGYGGPRR